MLVDTNARIEAMRASIAEWKNEDALSAHADEFAQAVAAFETAVNWILAKHPTAPAETAAGAAPFLHLAGTTVGGWLIGKQAAAATRRLASGGDPAFLEGNVTLARHYAKHALPPVVGYLTAMTEGASSVVGYADARL